MPEAVNTWQEEKNPSSVSQIQQDLIEIYEHDFLKHHDSLNSGRILQVFRSVASQLAKSNEKFIYGAIKEGGRAKDFEEAVEWLVSAGLLNRVYQSSKPEHPLPAYDNLGAFKLFLMDTGLLKHMSGVSNRAIILEESYQFKGPLTENYVLQQLCSVFQVTPRYYMEKNSEIDFLIQNESDIIPVEVKGGEDKSAPSFKKFIAKYRPPYAVRFSKRNYRKDGDILNIPLYLAGKITELL